MPLKKQKKIQNKFEIKLIFIFSLNYSYNLFLKQDLQISNHHLEKNCYLCQVI